MRLESLLINCPTFKTSYLPKTEQELPVIQGQFHSLDSQSLQQMPGELCQLPVHWCSPTLLPLIHTALTRPSRTQFLLLLSFFPGGISSGRWPQQVLGRWYKQQLTRLTISFQTDSGLQWSSHLCLELRKKNSCLEKKFVMRTQSFSWISVRFAFWETLKGELPWTYIIDWVRGLNGRIFGSTSWIQTERKKDFTLKAFPEWVTWCIATCKQKSFVRTFQRIIYLYLCHGKMRNDDNIRRNKEIFFSKHGSVPTALILRTSKSE